MANSPLLKTAPIVIIGAGVFGLSTSIHLSQRGYKNVTVVDKQQYDMTLYSYDLGCDAASADINKIMRCAYGADTVYQNLALEALEGWKEWNVELARSTNPPPGMSCEDVLYVNNGNLSFNDGADLPPFETLSLQNLRAAGQGHTQFVVGDRQDVERAKAAGFGSAVDPFHLASRTKSYNGVLDTAGGLLYADKSCRYALHKARSLGVKFIFGQAGTFASFTRSGSNPKSVTGIRTADGQEHVAALVIAAGGGWTPTIVPELDGLCETTAGSVAFYEIPRSSPLWDRFAPENFPTYAFSMHKGASGGVYGFPRDENGILKIGYRGTKYTNPVVQDDGVERSVPVTRFSPQPLKSIPSTAVSVIKSFVSTYLPELDTADIPLFESRMCWYTDSFDNHLVIDRVPGYENLMVATGGSGHAFKYLPVLGKLIVDVVEGKEGQGELAMETLRRWQWRSLGRGQVPINVLMEGSAGDRVLAKQVLVPDKQLQEGRALTVQASL